MRPIATVLVFLAGCVSGTPPMASSGPAGDGSFALHTRRLHDEKTVEWKASETAVIICDMWDAHWCRSATRRCGELAPKIDAFARSARARGALIIHAPSDVMKFYEGTAGRKLAQEAPKAKTDVPIGSCRLDPAREAPLPVDDSDGGCDDLPRCPGKPYPWTRQIAAIEIAREDAVSDRGDEIYALLVQRGIRNVLMTGVHTNMCVVGRSFAIRQMVKLGLNVALVRDLTDSMYNPRMRPFVAHERGTELIIEHIEKYWCPSVPSSDLLGN
jgi:nicotinamidase-related amidase